MIGDRRNQNADDDGNRFAELGGEDEGKQLCLVADFGESDDAGGDEEGFHDGSLAGVETDDHTTFPAKRKAAWSKVLPGSGTACAMAGWPSMLTQAPCREGRLLPNDGADSTSDREADEICLV